ncbi:MAG: DUF6508 domain-containing protein [Methanocalculus sp.]|uniref:DUF6508 domain-containing protein n=1 Tax=Methanocalculus sp. TaxID=2004547 RepID=UPI002728691F|nr:DUF6508 domain-containing protein [Methanocalculus sp.]MDO9538680.1 DUF6508 domain-containing protein [Methanocalculus sp.]
MIEKALLPLKDRLHGLAVYLPLFEACGFSFGHREEKDNPGIYHYTLSKSSALFIQSVYELGWVDLECDWEAWAHTSEALRLCDEPLAMRTATAKQLSHLLTAFILEDRVTDGILAAAFESGLIVAICRRAAELEVEIEKGTKQCHWRF